MSDVEIKPCPFCGTHVDDPDFPASEIHGGGGFTYECGGCGANWPRLTREKFETMSEDADVITFFNQREDAA